jgi:hypothetical protein
VLKGHEMHVFQYWLTQMRQRESGDEAKMTNLRALKLHRKDASLLNKLRGEIIVHERPLTTCKQEFVY